MRGRCWLRLIGRLSGLYHAAWVQFLRRHYVHYKLAIVALRFDTEMPASRGRQVDYSRALISSAVRPGQHFDYRRVRSVRVCVNMKLLNGALTDPDDFVVASIRTPDRDQWIPQWKDCDAGRVGIRKNVRNIFQTRPYGPRRCGWRQETARRACMVCDGVIDFWFSFVHFHLSTRAPWPLIMQCRWLSTEEYWPSDWAQSISIRMKQRSSRRK